jgi:hypothetical protein
MKVESLLLFLLALRYAYETKPLQYAVLSGLLEQYPNMLPEGARTPLEIVKIIDAVLYTQESSVQGREEDALRRSVQSLRTFASRFG